LKIISELFLAPVFVETSVVDPGSGAFLPLGSGYGMNFFLGPGSGSGMSYLFVYLRLVPEIIKIMEKGSFYFLSLFLCRTRDPERKMCGSGTKNVRIRDKTSRIRNTG
jgi:hypothetical protein